MVVSRVSHRSSGADEDVSANVGRDATSPSGLFVDMFLNAEDYSLIHALYTMSSFGTLRLWVSQELYLPLSRNR